MAYFKEIEFFAQNAKNRQISTIFFGGGTPSLMPTYFVDEILGKIAQHFQIDKNCEITLEANPTSFESAKFQEFKKAGINRLSIGIQALNDVDLKFLGRKHSAKEAIAVIELAAKIFDNFSFDLNLNRLNI
jgi:oxygen-independent coproporphyrinogen-3 oxidase